MNSVWLSSAICQSQMTTHCTCPYDEVWKAVHVKHGITFRMLHASASAPLSTQTMSLLWTAFVTTCHPKQESAPCFAYCSALIHTASPTWCGRGMWFAFSLLLCALAIFPASGVACIARIVICFTFHIALQPNKTKCILRVTLPATCMHSGSCSKGHC